MEINLRYKIKYIDADGSKTTRIIKPIEFYSEEGRNYVFAFCEKRKEDRNFRIDRIKSIVDVITGEILPLPQKTKPIPKSPPSPNFEPEIKREEGNPIYPESKQNIFSLILKFFKIK